MSAEELRRRSIDALSEARDREVERSLNIRFRPSIVGEKYIPPSTAEEIALQALEAGAMARGYTYAIAVINDMYRRMFQPDDDKIPEQKRKDIY